MAGRFTLHLGECQAVLPGLSDCSFDAVVCDPPYDLTNPGGGPHGKGMGTPFARAKAGASSGGFMGMRWDSTGVAFDPDTWRAVLRVLKPGGFLLAFGGSRTYHRMATAVEAAGFEVRDQIMWLYGSGFPKSHNLKGEWEGWGTALKPAHEPIVMARKPFRGTVEANVQAHGTGALNIDGCRVSVDDEDYARNCSGDRGHARTRERDQEGATNLRAGGGQAGSGRWPANVAHDGSEDVLEAFAQFGDRGAAAPVYTRRADKFRTTYGSFVGNVDEAGSTFHGDAGTAARFFYCAKATRKDRHEGLPDPGPQFKKGSTLRDAERLLAAEQRLGNHHPTVKPTELMRWLVRLVTPPGGLVLDPFMGSGSTGKACMLEGFRFVGIEREQEYLDIARQRIAAAVDGAHQLNLELCA